MKVSELIEMLKDLPQDALVYVNGYEGGIDDVSDVSLEYVERDTNINGAGYCGEHDIIYNKKSTSLTGFVIR